MANRPARIGDHRHVGVSTETGQVHLVSQILSHLGLPAESPQAAPAQPPTWLPGFAPQDDRV